LFETTKRGGVHLEALLEILYYVTIQFATTCDRSSFATMFLSFLQISNHRFHFIIIFVTMMQLLIIYPSILINFLGFSFENRTLCSFSHKITCNFVISCGVLIHFMYIIVFCTTLRIY
jgi:hypothetical protein